MTPKEYIVNALDNLVKQFPSVKAIYEHQKPTDTHVIQIEPLQMLKEDLFKAYEEKITFDFIKQYPWENIYFVTANSYTRIQEQEHVFIGKEFIEYEPLVHEFLYSCKSSHQTLKFSESFNAAIIHFFDTIIKSNSTQLIPSVRVASSVLVNKTIDIDIVLRPTESSNISCPIIVENAGESNYAMAA